MHEKITDKDIDFVATLHDPIAFKECLCPENIKSPHLWKNEDCKLVKIRNYQFSWQNYSYMLCDNSSLTEEENLKKKKLAGDCYNIGARNTGKSFDFIQMDTMLDIFHGSGKESCCGAGTQGFLTKVLNPVINFYRSHPFFKLFHLTGKKDGVLGGSQMEIVTRPGHTFYGRSENIDKPEPGTKFHGLHYDIFKYEEFHYATDKGEEKRIDSGNSLGYIKRFSGIPDIRLGSPLGRVLGDEKNNKFIVRYPQYCRADWNEKTKNERIEEYGGESNLRYKLNVLGEKIEGSEGFWDIQRIKEECLNKRKKIKTFGIDKKKFSQFKKHIVVDRLPAKQIYICADIGYGNRPTEIIIIFFDGKKYKLEYNIVLNKLSAIEQAKIFAYLYRKMGSAFIGIDATNSYAIEDLLEKNHGIPKKHILPVDLNKNWEIDFERNEEGIILRDNHGKEIIKKKRAIDLAMDRLEYLFYEGHMNIPIDNKLFSEFTDFRVIQSGTRPKYSSVGYDDYHQAFQVFAITQWDKEFETMRNQNNSDITWVY